MAERVFPAQAFEIGGGRILPSPNQFFLTGEDRLRIVSANSLTGVALKAQCRTANVQGDTVAHSFDHVPNTDRSRKATEHVLGSGSVLNVTIFASAGAPQMGHTFVMAQLIRGSGTAAIVLGTILAGYVTASQALGFPGSPIQSSVAGEPLLRTIIGTQPAAGGNFSETVPTGARWELLSVFVTFATIAGGANRAVYLVHRYGAAFLGVYGFNVTIAPVSNAQITLGAGLSVVSDAVNQLYEGPLGGRFLMLTGGQIVSAIYNIAAGDQLGAPQFQVREWLEVP